MNRKRPFKLPFHPVICIAGVLCFICTYPVWAQKSKADSLKALVPAAKDKEKADLLISISKQYFDNNSDSAVLYANRALDLTKKINYTYGEAEASRALGVAHVYGGEMNAQANFDRALEIFTALGDKKGIANTFNNLGLMWSRRHNDDSSFFFYNKALGLYRELKDKQGEGAVLNYISIVYQRRGDYPKASEYALLGLEVRRKANDYKGTVYSMLNAGNMYLEGGQYTSALELFEESIDFAKQHGLTPVDMSYNNLARTYLKMGEFAKAEEYLRKSSHLNNLLMAEVYSKTNRPDSALKRFKWELSSWSSPESPANHTEALVEMTRLLTERGNYEEAMVYGRQSFTLSDSIRHKQFKGQAAALLSTLYEKKGDYRQSLHYLRISDAIRDSVAGSDFQNKLAFYESKAKIEQEQARVRVLSAEKALQEQRAEEQRKNKNMVIWISALALGSAIVVILNINRQKKRIEIQKQLTEEQRARVESALAELKSTQAQLIQREKMASLGEMAAGVAHEIQNPLNFVNNFSELNMELFGEMNSALEAGNTRDAITIARDIELNLKKINEHGKRADSIVKGMQQHSQTNMGNKELTDINVLCDEYMKLSYHGMRAKEKEFQASLISNLDPMLGKINVNPQDIGRVLLNIYNNAFYSVNEKRKKLGGDFAPKVEVITKANPKDGVQIRIRDNGLGIPENIREKIFQPFFTTKPAGQGTGLGLSLSYDIITKGCGGEISFESREGQGTEFTLSIPLDRG